MRPVDSMKSALIILLAFMFLFVSLRTIGSLCESLRRELQESLEVERDLREKNSLYKVEIASLTRERLIVLTAMQKLNLRRANDEDTYVIK